MEFRVLGPMEVLADGRPVELSARRPRTLLAALLLRAGQVVPVDALAEAVWGGAAPAPAGSVLRMYVTQVRRALGNGRVVTIALVAVAADRGRDEEGGQLLGFAAMLLDRIGATMKPFEQRLFDRTQGRLLESLGEERLVEAIREGEHLEMDGVYSLSQTVAGEGAA